MSNDVLLGPFVGSLLLFATSASFEAVNLASDLVYVFVLPFAAIATICSAGRSKTASGARRGLVRPRSARHG